MDVKVEVQPLHPADGEIHSQVPMPNQPVEVAGYQVFCSDDYQNSSGGDFHVGQGKEVETRYILRNPGQRSITAGQKVVVTNEPLGMETAEAEQGSVDEVVLEEAVVMDSGMDQVMAEDLVQEEIVETVICDGQDSTQVYVNEDGSTVIVEEIDGQLRVIEGGGDLNEGDTLVLEEIEETEDGNHVIGQVQHVEDMVVDHGEANVIDVRPDGQNVIVEPIDHGSMEIDMTISGAGSNNTIEVSTTNGEIYEADHGVTFTSIKEEQQQAVDGMSDRAIMFHVYDKQKHSRMPNPGQSRHANQIGGPVGAASGHPEICKRLVSTQAVTPKHVNEQSPYNLKVPVIQKTANRNVKKQLRDKVKNKHSPKSSTKQERTKVKTTGAAKATSYNLVKKSDDSSIQKHHPVLTSLLAAKHPVISQILKNGPLVPPPVSLLSLTGEVRPQPLLAQPVPATTVPASPINTEPHVTVPQTPPPPNNFQLQDPVIRRTLQPTGKFRCKLCTYSCTAKHFLYRHFVQKHCLLRPYHCVYCEQTSAVKDAITRHQTITHRGLARQVYIDVETEELVSKQFSAIYDTKSLDLIQTHYVHYVDDENKVGDPNPSTVSAKEVELSPSGTDVPADGIDMSSGDHVEENESCLVIETETEVDAAPVDIATATSSSPGSFLDARGHQQEMEDITVRTNGADECIANYTTQEHSEVQVTSASADEEFMSESDTVTEKLAERDNLTIQQPHLSDNVACGGNLESHAEKDSEGSQLEEHNRDHQVEQENGESLTDAGEYLDQVGSNPGGGKV